MVVISINNRKKHKNVNDKVQKYRGTINNFPKIKTWKVDIRVCRYIFVGVFK